jgi:hypothetical protein
MHPTLRVRRFMCLFLAVALMGFTPNVGSAGPCDTPTQTQPMLLSLQDPVAFQGEPKLTRGPNNLLLTYAWSIATDSTTTRPYSIRGQLLTTSGLPASSEFSIAEPIPGRGSSRFFSVASNGTNYCIAWSANFDSLERTTFPKSVWVGVVSAAGAVSAVQMISEQFLGEYPFPSVVWDGTNYVVAWLQPGRNLYAARVTSSGSLLDVTPIPVHVGGAILSASIGWVRFPCRVERFPQFTP